MARRCGSIIDRFYDRLRNVYWLISRPIVVFYVSFVRKVYLSGKGPIIQVQIQMWIYISIKSQSKTKLHSVKILSFLFSKSIRYYHHLELNFVLKNLKFILAENCDSFFPHFSFTRSQNNSTIRPLHYVKHHTKYIIPKNPPHIPYFCTTFQNFDALFNISRFIR